MERVEAAPEAELGEKALDSGLFFVGNQRGAQRS